MFDHGPPQSPLAPDLPQDSLQQSLAWLEAVRLLEGGVAIEALSGKRAVVLRKRLPLMGEMALITRADLALDAVSAADLRHEMKTRHLMINAETPADAQALCDAGFHRIAAARTIAELELAPSASQMAAGLHQKWRNRLRKGQDQGLVIRRRPMAPDKKHWLFQAEKAQARRLWYSPLPPELIAAIVACAPGSGQIFTAYHLGRRVAAMLFLRHGRSATYQIGWTSAEGRLLSAGPAVMWRAMVELQAMGVERIDLGAADASSAPGLARFKLGTGARPRPLGGTWMCSAWAGPRWWRRPTGPRRRAA